MAFYIKCNLGIAYTDFCDGVLMLSKLYLRELKKGIYHEYTQETSKIEIFEVSCV